VLVAIQELRPAVGVEPYDEIAAVGDGRYAGAVREGPPFAKNRHVLGDVKLVVLAPLLLEPSLGRLAMGSGGGGVESDLHGFILPVGTLTTR
jgi:hypothetical protein